MSDVCDKLKRAYRRGTGVRLTADEVTMLLEDTAIQDAAYPDYEELVRDRDGGADKPFKNESKFPAES